MEISNALKLQNAKVVRETEEAERDRASDLATDAFAQCSKSLLPAIRDVKSMIISANDEE